MYNRALSKTGSLPMPIYEYLCAGCQHQFDRLQKLADAPLVTCPECGKDTLKKLVSAPSFRLSGSGWYETDFKTDKDKKKNLAGDAGKSNNDGAKKAASTGANKKDGAKAPAAKKNDSASAKSA